MVASFSGWEPRSLRAWDNNNTQSVLGRFIYRSRHGKDSLVQMMCIIECYAKRAFKFDAEALNAVVSVLDLFAKQQDAVCIMRKRYQSQSIGIMYCA